MRYWLFLFLLYSAGVQAADQATLATGDVLRGHFVEEKHLQGFKSAIKSEGRFTISPARGLLWDVQKPFATSTIITPNGLMQTIQGKPVTELSAQKIPFMLHLYDMLAGALTGDWRAMDVDFIVARDETADGWRAALTPREQNNPAMPYTSISVSGHRFVERVILTKPDGDTDSMMFDDQRLSSASVTATEQAAFDSVKP